MEAAVTRTAGKVMNTMAELVEQGDHFLMLQQTGFVRGRFRKVADKCSSWIPARSVGLEEARLEVEVGSMAVFALARVQIQVQVANKIVTFRSIVPDAEDNDVVVPCNILCLSGGADARTIFGGKLNKDETKEVLKDLEHAGDCVAEGEVLGNLVSIDAVFLHYHQPVVISVVPKVVVAVKLGTTRLRILLLDLKKMFDLLLTTISKAGAKVVEEILHSLGRLGHLVLNAHSCVVGVADKTRSLISQYNNLAEQLGLVSKLLVGRKD